MNCKEPLGIPKGSVRAFLAIIITAFTLTSAMIDFSVFQLVLPLCALVIGFYFGRRA